MRSPLAALWQALGDRIAVQCGAQVECVEPAASGALVVNARTAAGEQVEEADAVVLAAPAAEAGRAARALVTPPERDFLSSRSWRPAVVLTVGIDGQLASRPRLTQFPRSLGLAIETLLVEPGVAGGRAPAGASLAQLRATSPWSAAHLGVPEETLEKECLGLLERVAPEVRGRVRFARVDRFERAVPAFRVGDYRGIDRFLRVQTDRRRSGRRIYFAGDYLSGPSLEAALGSGRRAAEALLEDLGRRAG